MFSNHRAFFIDFDTKSLFGSILNHLPPIQARDVRASNPKDVTKYCQELHRMLHARNMVARSEELLQSSERNNELAESLSCDMDQFQTATAKYCSKRYTPVWSEKIASSRAKVGILKRALFMCCTKYNTEEQMGNLQHQAGERIQLPRTEQECITLLRKEQKELKELINKDRKLR